MAEDVRRRLVCLEEQVGHGLSLGRTRTVVIQARRIEKCAPAGQPEPSVREDLGAIPRVL